MLKRQSLHGNEWKVNHKKVVRTIIYDLKNALDTHSISGQEFSFYRSDNKGLIDVIWRIKYKGQMTKEEQKQDREMESSLCSSENVWMSLCS